MQFELNIYPIRSMIKPNSLIQEWQDVMRVVQVSFNKYFWTNKFRIKGVRVFSIQYINTVDVKAYLPDNPLGDTAWIHYRYLDESIFNDQSGTIQNKNMVILNEVYYSLQLLCKQKDIPENTFEGAYKWVLNNIK